MRKFLMMAFAMVIATLAMVDVALAAEVVAVESDWLAFVKKYWVVVPSFMTFAAAVAAATPTPKDDGIVLVLRRIIDFVGLNIGFAKNKD